MEVMNDFDKWFYLLLRDFIRDGFPECNVQTQVGLAALYAQTIVDFKLQQAQKDSGNVIPTNCPNCNSILKRMDTGTLEESSFSMICLDPACRYVWTLPKKEKGE